MSKYLVHIEPIPIDDSECKDIKKYGFHTWIFEQAELKNIQYDWIEKQEKTNEWRFKKRK